MPLLRFCGFFNAGNRFVSYRTGAIPCLRSLFIPVSSCRAAAVDVMVGSTPSLRNGAIYPTQVTFSSGSAKA